MALYNDYSIRPLLESDLRMVLQWRNSERVRANSFSEDKIEWDSHYAWFCRLQTDSAHRYYIVEFGEKPIGVVYFRNIDGTNKKCEWGLYLGETTAPRGSGTIMGALGLSTAFGHLGVRKICAEVLAFNMPSVRLHERLGFLQEGCLSRHVWKNGKFEDVLLYSIFSEDWAAQQEGMTRIPE